MFSCWRTLTAAAGALCLPYAFLQAPSLGDDFAGTRPAISPLDRNFLGAPDSYGTESDSWYQRYYRNYCNEILTTPLTYPTTEITPADAAIEQDREIDSSDSADDSADQSMSLDLEGRCDDPTCPCHETFDSDSGRESDLIDTSNPVIDKGAESSDTDDQFMNRNDDLSDEFADDFAPFDDSCTDPNCASNQPDVSDAIYPQCPFGRTTKYMDVYEPYAHDAETGDERSINRAPAVLLPNLVEIDRQVPPGDSFVDPLDEQSNSIEDGCENIGGTQLSGTIEPEEENDEADQEMFDGAAQQQDDREIGESDCRIEEDSDPAGEFQRDTTFEANEDSGDETSAKPPIHLFYPGQDWSPYYPSESNTEEETDVTPTEPAIEQTANPWTVRLPFQGAAWANHGAMAAVTWTGKLAERCATMIGQAFPQGASAKF